MAQMRKWLVVCFFLPTVCFATVGESLNAVLDGFWKGGKSLIELITPPKKKEASPQDFSVQGLDEEASFQEGVEQLEVLVPQHVTRRDWDQVKEDIFFEEDALDLIEQDLREKENKLNTIFDQKEQVESDLYSGDAQLSQLKNKIDTVVAQVEKWEQEVREVTRNRTYLQSHIRIEQKKLAQMLKADFLRREGFSTREGAVDPLRWLFSEKSVSELFQERTHRQRLESEKRTQIKKLDGLKSDLAQRERYGAKLLKDLVELKTALLVDRTALSQALEQKANEADYLDYSEGKLVREVENLRRQQADSTIELQILRQRMDSMAQKIETDESSSSEKGGRFSFPLDIPIKIAARFEDPEYEKAMGRSHKGIDFVAPEGTDIFAPADGQVVKVETNGRGYSYFALEHDYDLHTVYGHVSDILVNEGQMVKKGDLIGRTGGTKGEEGAGSFTTGPHLHFEVLRGGMYVDPMRYLRINSN